MYFGHFKSSRRILFIASIGLICALTIVSSTNYYFDNSKKALIDDYFVTNNSSNPYYSTDLSISVSFSPPYDNQVIPTLELLINQSIKDYDINFFKSINKSQFISGLSITAKINSLEPGLPSIGTNSSVNIIEISSDMKNELIELNKNNALMDNSRLPNTNSQLPEIFALFFSDYDHYDRSYSLVNESNIIKAYDCSNCFETQSNEYQLNVTGMAYLYPYNYIHQSNGTSYKNPDYDKYPILRELRYSSYYYNYYYTSNIFLLTTNITKIATLLHPLVSTNRYYYNSVSLTNNIFIYFDYNKIDPYNSGEIVNKINLFRTNLYDKIFNQFSNKIDFLVTIDFRSQYKFDSINSILSSFIFILFLVSLPILLVTIFIINYSFGLIRKNVVQHIGVYKTRGATSRMIFFFQITDNVFIILMSIIIALFTGLPLSMLVLQTDFLLSFNYPAPSYYILNFQPIINLLLYVAVILTISVNFKRVLRFSRISIVETEQPIEKEEPAWKRHYFDIILFSFGLLMYMIFYLLLKNPTNVDSFGPLFGIITILIIPAPFALVLGLILIANRIIPVTLNKIGTMLWEKTGDLLAFSFKNVVRHKQASTRAVMLIAILISFMVFFYSLPYSLVLNNERTLYYNNGAEVVGSFGNDGYNETSLDTILENFSQYLEAFSPYMLVSTQYISSIGYSQIMFVNTSTYSKAAYLNFDLGLKKDLSNDLKNLKPINASDSSFIKLLVDQRTVENRKSGIGENLTIIGTNTGTNLKVQIVDSFKNWPILKSHRGSNFDAIGDITYYLQTLNKTLIGSLISDINEQGILFNFKDGVNQTLISSWIEGNTSITITSLTAEAQKQYYTGIQFRLTVGQINNDILMVIAISMIVLVMFAYLQLTERKKEIYTERALGMKLRQLALLFLIETVILSLTSSFLGISVGFFLMELLALLILNPEQSYPAFELIFPIELIIGTIALILISSLIVSIIPAYYVTKQDISKSFGEM